MKTLTPDELTDAALDGDVDFLAYALKNGADPNTLDDEDFTPLLAICLEAGKMNKEVLNQVFNILFSCDRLDVNRQDSDKHSPFYLALRNLTNESTVLAVERLLSHKDLDINAFCSEGWTPLMTAAANSAKPLILKMMRRLLIHPKIEINKPHLSGWTALSIAACYSLTTGSLSSVFILLDQPGLDLNTGNRYKQTFLDVFPNEKTRLEALVYMTRKSSLPTDIRRSIFIRTRLMELKNIDDMCLFQLANLLGVPDDLLEHWKRTEIASGVRNKLFDVLSLGRQFNAETLPLLRKRKLARQAMTVYNQYLSFASQLGLDSGNLAPDILYNGVSRLTH